MIKVEFRYARGTMAICDLMLPSVPPEGSKIVLRIDRQDRVVEIESIFWHLEVPGNPFVMVYVK